MLLGQLLLLLLLLNSFVTNRSQGYMLSRLDQKLTCAWCRGRWKVAVCGGQAGHGREYGHIIGAISCLAMD